MVWIVVGVTAVLGFVVTVLVLTRRQADDLGAVSVQWLTEHRAER